jgi:hypothetical protein
VGEVSSFRGANTVFEGQQIRQREETPRQKRDTERRRRRDTDRRETGESTQIGETQRRDRREITEQKRSKDRSETQRQKVRVHCKRKTVVTTSEVVNKEV